MDWATVQNITYIYPSRVNTLQEHSPHIGSAATKAYNGILKGRIYTWYPISTASEVECDDYHHPLRAYSCALVLNS